MTRGTQPTQSPPPRAPGEPIAPVPDGRPARALSVHITSVSDGPPPTTVGTPHQGLVPTLAPGEPIASVSDGRPARVPSVHITSVSDGRPPTTASAPPRGPGTAADATATAASAADTGMEVGTDPIPTMAAPPTAERISSFLSCIRQSAADDDMATAASAVGTLATPPPSDVNVHATGGGTDAGDAAPPSPEVTVDTSGASATKKRRRKQSRPTARDGQRHCQRMAQLGAVRGDPPRSDPGPIDGHPAEDWAGW